jgi:hypothetical protein
MVDVPYLFAVGTLKEAASQVSSYPFVSLDQLTRYGPARSSRSRLSGTARSSISSSPDLDPHFHFM